MDFAALPPEINSGRIYAGPGSAPLLAAAGAWRGLAGELSSTAAHYESAISGLVSQGWSGPSAAAMAGAAAPYVAWLLVTAGRAEQSAAQAMAAAAAYDAAFTAVVPPPVIAANRSLLTTLIATNVLGQNTAAIAATEAHYGEMWAQDAAAMYGYAAASASAARLTPYQPPPATTNPVGTAGQGGAVANAAAATGAQAEPALGHLIAMVPQALQGLAASGPSALQAESPIAALLSFLAGPTSPISLFPISGVPYLLAIQCVMLPMNGSNVLAAVGKATAAGVLSAETVPADGLAAGLRLAGSSGGPTPTVAAGSGRAGSVGRLSVPHGWAAASAPAVTPVSAVLSGATAATGPIVAGDDQSSLLSGLALGGLAGRAIGAGGGVASRAVGGATGSLAASKPSAATIIVIPPSAED